MNEKKDPEHRTEFTGQPIELNCGTYLTADGGVMRYKGDTPVMVITHPLTITRRLVNLDTGITKVELAYRRTRGWRRMIVDRSTIAVTKEIAKLADHDIAVNQKNAGEVMTYLSTLEERNIDDIPQADSAGRMGYTSDGKNFLPYDDAIVFDGEDAFRSLFAAIHAEGTLEEWQHAALELVKTIPGRLVLAASFASALVEPLHCLPFFVHLWGVESGTGKTLALMGAASAWADPGNGKYIQTFNSTAVGHERIAEFLHNLPLIIDEMQISKDSKGQIRYDPYKLAEGIGRTRGNRTGGVEKTTAWRNCIITSGETPMVEDTAAAGAKNRAIEIEVTQPLMENGHALAARFSKNFGIAGRMFVQYVMQNRDTVEAVYSEYVDKLTKVSQKQALSGALLLTADAIITSIGILPKLRWLTPEDLRPYLKTKEDIDVNASVYKQICDWVIENLNSFEYNGREVERGSCYGSYESNERTAYILPRRFDEAVSSFGGVPRSFLKWLRSRGLLRLRDGSRGFQYVARINGVSAGTVALRLPPENAEAGQS